MNINDFAKELVVRIKKDFDSIIVIDSGATKGTGKSVFSMLLCKAICKLIDYKYSFNLIIFNPTDEKLIKKVKSLPEGTPIHIDEGSRVLYKRDYQKEYQKNLIKFINICRKFKKIIIINNPDFWDMDKDLRNLCDFRVIIIRRGLAQVMGKSPIPDLKDKWLRDKAVEKTLLYTKGDIHKLEKVRTALSKLPNFLYNIAFSDMKKEEYEKYVELSKKEELKAFISDKDRETALRQITIYMLSKYVKNQQKLATEINKVYYSTFWYDRKPKGLISQQLISNVIKVVENALLPHEDL